MENDMDEAGICCHECRTTRQKLANYTSGGDEAAAAAAASSNDTPDLSAFLEESMEVNMCMCNFFGQLLFVTFTSFTETLSFFLVFISRSLSILF